MRKYTLKEMFDVEQRASRADQIIAEDVHVEMIIEALDKTDLQRTYEIINKLSKLKGKGSKLIDTMVQSTVDEINKFTGGTGTALEKMANVFKKATGVTNPVLKGLRLVNALEQGFSQLPAVLKNFGIEPTGKTNKSSSILELIMNDDPKGGQERAKTLQQSLKNMFRPAGLFSGMKLPETFNTNTLSAEILNMPIGNIVEIYNSLIHGVTTNALDKDVTDAVKTSSDDGKPQKGSLSNDKLTKLASTISKNTGVDIKDVNTVLNMLNVTRALREQ